MAKQKDRRQAAKNIAAIARGMTESLLNNLYTIATDEEQPAASRIAASKEIMDRALGRAPQGIELTGEDGGPIEGTFTVEFVGKDTKGV